MKLISHLPDWKCTNKRIVLRADLNVPLDGGTILSDMRLRAIQPTLDEIIRKNATTILITHIGRPKTIDASLSTRALVPWFQKNSYPIIFASTIQHADELSLKNPGSVILLENLRFFPEEKEKNIKLAKELARLGDYFVQDAFGSLDNDDTSITLLPEQFDASKRTIGLLIEKELSELDALITNIAHPFCIILGGNKASDKIPLIKHMRKRADSILLCPALVFSFLKAEGIPVGKSLVENSVLDTCKTILQKNNLTFPLDYLVAEGDENGPLSFVDVLKTQDFGISIGPKTIAFFSELIKDAQTVFFNGAIGFSKRPETLEGMHELFRAMAKSKGKSIIAGGDSSAALEQLDIKGITYVSTGGGAALAYLSGQPLPGLKPFI